MQSIPAAVTSLAIQFPHYASKILGLVQSLYQSYQNQSPETQAKISSTVKLVKKSSKAVLDYGASVYPTVMQWGTVDVLEYQQPSHYILNPIANTITTIFPTNSNINESTMSDLKCVGLVGNHTVIGTISLVSHIYLKTGKLTRVLNVDSIHFKIPIWKHMIEYFGCVDQSNPKIVDILKAEDTIFICFNGELQGEYVVLPYSTTLGCNRQTRIELPLEGGTITVPTSYQNQNFIFGDDLVSVNS